MIGPGYSWGYGEERPYNVDHIDGTWQVFDVRTGQHIFSIVAPEVYGWQREKMLAFDVAEAWNFGIEKVEIPFDEIDATA